MSNSYVTPWTVAYQASLSMGFSRQEYWSGLPFPSPGDLLNPGIKPGSPALEADALNSELKSSDITLLTKVCLVKAMVFPVVIYGCESWTVQKAECQRIDVFELWCWRRFLSPLDCKVIQPVHSKGDQSWVFFGRNDAKVETPVLWPLHVKC